MEPNKIDMEKGRAKMKAKFIWKGLGQIEIDRERDEGKMELM